MHFLLLLKIVRSPTWTGPGAKLSHRSAIRGKVRLFAGSVWSWPQGQAEVGRDQEHPGNTSHGPNMLKFGQTCYNYMLNMLRLPTIEHNIRYQLYLVKF